MVEIQSMLTKSTPPSLEKKKVLLSATSKERLPLLQEHWSGLHDTHHQGPLHRQETPFTGNDSIRGYGGPDEDAEDHCHP